MSQAATIASPFATIKAAIRIPQLSASFLSRARGEGLDDQGQPVLRLEAEGGEPCRDVLRRALPGERLILASHSPFSRVGPYREFGPVFILAAESAAPVRRDVIPFEAEPDPYLRDQFVIRAYSHGEEILDAVMATPQSAPAIVDRFFNRPDTAFLHLRFPTYGCFACRIDRA